MNNLDLWRKNSSDLTTLLDNFFRGDFPAWSAQMEKAISARCEISETPAAYQLKFEVPGLRKDDIKVDLHDNRLTVSGEKRDEKTEEKGKKVHYSELSYGSFMRTYTFPTKVDSERVQATYDGGVLIIEVAKSGASPARQIPIK